MLGAVDRLVWWLALVAKYTSILLASLIVITLVGGG